jgi:poly-gamma-glutamate capsule biosynthesis protein CapA/YwtB (metallophosphatase superfamily)
MTSEIPSRAYKSLFEAAGAAVDMAAEAAAFEAAAAAFEAARAAFEAAALALAGAVAAGAAAAAAGAAAAACHGEAAPSVEMSADRRADLSVRKPGSSTSPIVGCFRSNIGCLLASKRSPPSLSLQGVSEHQRALGRQGFAEQKAAGIWIITDADRYTRAADKPVTA